MSIGRSVILTAAAVLASSGCVVGVDSQGHTAREEKRFEVAGIPEVHLVTFNGSIDVRTWDRDEVLVEVQKRGQTREDVESIEVKADQSGNRVQVEARRPQGGDTLLGIGIHISRSARLIATVPRRANVLVRTGDGTIRIDRVDGRIELRTGDGSVKGTDLKGAVTIDTGDGTVTLQNVEGALDARTGDGGVSASGKLDAVRVRTSDGTVTLRAEPGSVMSDNWDVSTGDGGVVLYLPDGFGAEIDAQTNDGRVSADHDLGVDARRSDGHTLRGRLGDGGHTLKVRTGDGGISLRVS
jgi:DUF4097 and DUF4098 domain-containing protein YvlB